jgi:Asp-tRNA(Asn)/Glu-tRNA(Gln) amidotransferase A subunit family amidase
MKENVHYQSIKELSKLIQEQKISPVEVVDRCLKRIEALNPTLNAFIKRK